MSPEEVAERYATQARNISRLAAADMTDDDEARDPSSHAAPFLTCRSTGLRSAVQQALLLPKSRSKGSSMA